MSGRARYEKHLKELELSLVTMCREVEQSIGSAIKAYRTRDKELAKKVYDNDTVIDNMEHDLEQACLKMLLLEHPVATDFKEVSAILKIITDLERIGDQAADISHLILSFDDDYVTSKAERIFEMGRLAESMVKDSINAYITRDREILQAIEKRDDEVDRLFDEIKEALVRLIKSDSKVNPDQVFTTLMIAKYLERIADHATNICEWTEYSLGGQRQNKN